MCKNLKHTICAHYINVCKLSLLLLSGYLGCVLGDGIDFRQSTLAGAGDGLFALRAFRKGEVVTFYDGILLHVLKVTGKFNKSLSCDNANWSHWRSVPERDLVIKGVSRNHGACNGRGGASIANHMPEKKNCSLKNARFYIPMFCEVDFEWTMVRPTIMITTRKVLVGEELFVDYGVSRTAAHEIPSSFT